MMYSVTINFDDGAKIECDVEAINEARAYALALIDARMAHPGPVAYGRVLNKEIKSGKDQGILTTSENPFEGEQGQLC